LIPRFLPGGVRFHRRGCLGFIDTGKVCRGWAASAKRIIGIWYRGVSFGFLAFSCVILGVLVFGRSNIGHVERERSASWDPSIARQIEGLGLGCHVVKVRTARQMMKHGSRAIALHLTCIYESCTVVLDPKQENTVAITMLDVVNVGERGCRRDQTVLIFSKLPPNLLSDQRLTNRTSIVKKGIFG
jgi:hypothetical protein